MMHPSQLMFWNREDGPYDHFPFGEYFGSDLYSPIDLGFGWFLPDYPPDKKHIPCKFFKKGNCRRGEFCWYSHHTEIQTDEAASSVVPCVYFQKGYCRYGDNCRYSHSTAETTVESSAIFSTEADELSEIAEFEALSVEEVSRTSKMRLCLDSNIKGSEVQNRKRNGNIHGPYYIGTLVNKDVDSLQYLYDWFFKNVNHPLYTEETVVFEQAGGHHFNDFTTKLKDLNVCLFQHNCVEVLLVQSFHLMSLALKQQEAEFQLPKDRYQPSQLDRNPDGTFTQSDVYSLIEARPRPPEEELFPGDTTAELVKPEEFEDCSIPARHFHTSARYGNDVRVHSEEQCEWCVSRGCSCLSEEVSRDNDDEIDECMKDESNTFECGVFPEEIQLDKIKYILEKEKVEDLRYGDIITFGDYRGKGSYILGKNEKLIKYEDDGTSHVIIPFEITVYLKDVLKKYKNVVETNRSTYVVGFYLRHDDISLSNSFNGKLPSIWKYSAYFYPGTSNATLLSDDLHSLYAEFDNGHQISMEPTNPDDERARTEFSTFSDMLQRYQSTKESSSWDTFVIELSLRDNEEEKLHSKYGFWQPRVNSWEIEGSGYTHGSSGEFHTEVIFKGPKSEAEIVKAIAETFYDGVTWRYARKEN